jgi:predicted ATPase
MLADAQLIAGNADAALAQVEGALCISARTGEAWYEAELHRRVGSILLLLNRPDDIGRAESEFGRALAIARSQSALLFELRAACALARLRRDQGRLAEAPRLLSCLVFPRSTRARTCGETGPDAAKNAFEIRMVFSVHIL